MHTFQGKGFCFELAKQTYIMGILNLTPDSFYDGGKWNTEKAALRHAAEMQENGADILDIGAQSTRPGHKPLSAEQELDIVKRFLDPLMQIASVPVSIDTFYPSVAAYCLAHGVSIVNDVSGVFNPEMAAVVKAYDAGWIIMHTGGGTAAEPAVYPRGVVADVLSFFECIKQQAAAYGIEKSRICFDMGIGFGKTYADNLELLKRIRDLKASDTALLTALSNKRVISAASGAEGADRVYGTIAADTLAIAGSTDFIRVHEVKEAAIAARMADSICRK